MQYPYLVFTAVLSVVLIMGAVFAAVSWSQWVTCGLLFANWACAVVLIFGLRHNNQASVYMLSYLVISMIMAAFGLLVAVWPQKRQQPTYVPPAQRRPRPQPDLPPVDDMLAAVNPIDSIFHRHDGHGRHARHA